MDPVLKSEDLTVDLRDGTKRPLVITKAIGQGSFGTVWKGFIDENIVVAVKQTRRTSKQAVAEFEKEIAIMQHLQSEYVVRVYGSVTLESSLLIVMEYIGLGSLAELVERNYLSPRMRMMYALHVCRGMKYLHAMKVIHRDLKPGNVLCVSNNIDDPVLCKITDFGASRVTDQDSTATFTMTKGIGSPFYMSPEMLRNDKQYTRAIDVYSFAIMCVELWNLQLPFSEHDFESAVGLFLNSLNNRQNTLTLLFFLFTQHLECKLLQDSDQCSTAIVQTRCLLRSKFAGLKILMNDCVCFLLLLMFLVRHMCLFLNTAFEEIEEELDKVIEELKRQEEPGTVHMRPKNVDEMY